MSSMGLTTVGIVESSFIIITYLSLVTLRIKNLARVLNSGILVEALYSSEHDWCDTQKQPAGHFETN